MLAFLYSIYSLSRFDHRSLSRFGSHTNSNIEMTSYIDVQRRYDSGDLYSLRSLTKLSDSQPQRFSVGL